MTNLIDIKVVCEHDDFIENGVCGNCGAIVESNPDDADLNQER